MPASERRPGVCLRIVLRAYGPPAAGRGAAALRRTHSAPGLLGALSLCDRAYLCLCLSVSAF